MIPVVIFLPNSYEYMHQFGLAMTEDNKNTGID